MSKLFSVFLLMTIPMFGANPPKTLKGIPLVRQSTSYSCGAAALQSVLDFYGHEFNESEVMTGVNTRAGYGTDTRDIVAFSNKEGIAAAFHTNLGLEDLEKEITNGRPVLVEIQAWNSNPATNYKEDYDDGHYVVVVGFDNDGFYFMDPSLLGSNGVLPRTEFSDRWHDLSKDKVKRNHSAVFFEGTPKPPPPLAKID